MTSQIANISGAPYWDDYDPSKKFSQIIFVNGRAVQAREFTQIQTMFLELLKRLSGAFLKEGSIISGMDFSISNNVVTVHPGMLYLNGMIHMFDGASIQIVGVGAETVGVRLVQNIITFEDDNTLRDPAQGYKNYSQPGADRIQNTIQLTLNDNTVPTLYTFQDGVLKVAVQTPEINSVQDALAKRTYDTAGNYKVRGFRFVAQNLDANNVQLVVDAGAAYVMGYNVVKPGSTTLSVPKSQTSRQVVGEIKVYHNGTLKYTLNNNYAKDITQVIATVSKTSTITRGATANGMDALPFTPVVAIQSVVQGGTTYVAGTSYQLSGNNVDWSLSGAEPASGSTYTVTYTYSKVMVLGTDYQLSYDGTTPAISYLDFNLGGDKPVDSTNVTVTYDFYLARQDRVYLDQNGNITTVQGIPDVYPNEVVPLDTDSTKLSLGTFELLPNSSTVNCTVDSYKNVSMKDIQAMLTRLDNLEYNQALSNLDQQAMSGQSPTNLKGIFTDGFLGFTKADLTHPLFNASIDIGQQYLMQASDYTLVAPTLDTTNSTVHNWGDRYTAAFTEHIIISQPFGTRSVNVNPYSVFTTLANMTISPSTDNWIDPNTVVVNSVSTKTKFVRNWTGWWKYRSTPILSGTQTTSVSATVDSIEPYARPQTITVSGSGFPAYSDNLAATVDGVTVTLTPGLYGSAGTTTGTLKADANGNVSGTMTLPATKIRTGSRSVVLSNNLVSAQATYTAQGIQHTTNITNNIVDTYTQYQRPVDPVAQSFQVYNDTMVTSVNLYFTAKGNNNPVTIMIRDMVNGYPGQNILASATLTPSSVNTDATGATATKVSFTSPAWLKANTQYCIVVATVSTNYQLAVATLAGTDMHTNQYVTGNPYNDGVLFLSSNNMTWTPDQTSDLKFDLLAASFSSSSLLQFTGLTGLDVDGFVMAVSQDLPQGTSAKWEYQWTDNNWYPISTNVVTDLSNNVTSLGLRATLYSSADSTLSPVVSASSLNFAGMKVNQSSTYVSKLVNTTQAYSNIKVVHEANIPAGASVNVYITTDDSTWTQLSVSTSTAVDSGFTQYQYSYTIPSSGTSTKYRVRIDFGSSVRTAKPQVRKLMNILT